MCLAIPGRIISIENGWAVVDVLSVISKVNIQLIRKPEIGDSVLIHAGCAIQIISPEESSYLQRVLTELAAGDDTIG